MMKNVLIPLGLFAVVTACAAQQVVPAQSELGFTFKQMGVPVKGQFKRWQAQVAFDPAKPEAAKIQITVAMNSVAFGAPEAEAEVVKPDWFDVSKHPTATFESRSVMALAGNRFQVNGVLTIKGQPQPAVVPVTLTQQGGNGTASGTLAIKRLDYKIGGGEWADPSLVANEVQVNFKIALTGLPTGATK